jgi:hypothetical protein
MWKLLEHRRPKLYSELLLAAALKELVMYTSSTYAESFQDNFERIITDIKLAQQRQLWHMYRCTVRSPYCVEIFKLDASGIIKHIAYTVTYQKP